MSSETIPTGNWRTHLLISGGVLLTVLFALLLSQLDGLQRQILPSPVAVALANLNATPTNTPLPAIPLASGTPTAPPFSNPNGNEPDTAVSLLPNCQSAPSGWVLTPVQSGETILTLSLRYNISEEKIRLANCLEPGSLMIRNQLYLPTAATPNAPIVCGPPAHWVQYSVRRGQTMFSLASSRGTTITAVLNANCLDSTNLQAGQVIFLPPSSFVPPTATVTPSATATSTPTATASSTATATNTPPALPTNSATPTTTATGTVTATPSTTATATPSATPTPSASPTATPSATPTNSATLTVTASPTLTPTPSSTPTATATPTATDTAVPTATVSPTSSPTPSPTATP